MFELISDISKSEPISDNITWREFKKTRLYGIYAQHRANDYMRDISKNLELMLAGSVPPNIAHCYGITLHDERLPWKTYLYLKHSMLRVAKKI